VSWASDKARTIAGTEVSEIQDLERAIRETIEEAARQCDEPTVTRDARAGRAVIKQRILAMLEDAP